MHISDGVLSLPVIAAGWIITTALLVITLWWAKGIPIPLNKMALV